MERRSVQAIFDCEVEITEISMAAIRARQEGRSREWVARGNVPEPIYLPPEQNVHDSALLQEAILRHPASLDAWVLHEVVGAFDYVGIRVRAPARGEDSRILAPVIDSLPPEERHRLREAVAARMLYEHVSEFFHSFDATILRVDLRHADDTGTSPGTDRSRARPTRSRSRGRDGPIERRFVRAVVDCEVAIRDITMAAAEARRDKWLRERLAQRDPPSFIPELPSEQEVEDAMLLQEALRADPASLDAWVLQEVATMFAIEGVEAAEPPEGEEERILGPVVERLPPVQRHRFREALANDRLFEPGEEFYWSFDVNVHGVELQHVDGPGSGRW